MKSLIEKFNQNIHSLFPEIEKETNKLITEIEKNKPEYLSKIDSTQKEDKEFIKKTNNKIEYQLDLLTNPYTEKQFYRVLKHWEKLNPESAKDYKKIFKDLYE